MKTMHLQYYLETTYLFEKNRKSWV